MSARSRFAAGWGGVAALVAAGSLAACVVFPYGPYWKPEADGATYGRAWCGGQAGPFNNATLGLGEGGSARLQVMEDKARRYVFVNLRTDATLVLGADQRIVTAQRAHLVPTELRRTEYRDGRFDVRVLDDRTIRVGDRAGFALEVTLPADVGDEFTYWLPGVRVDGRDVAVPPVRFVYRRLDSGVQPFNC